MSPRRNRWVQLAGLLLAIALGLGSRSRLAHALPPWLAEYAGDTLWALMVFLGVGLIFPSWSICRVAVAALAISFAIEFSQLYQGQWLNELRQNRIGALVLGRGFLWSDLLCYTVGVLVGVGVEGTAKMIRGDGRKVK